MLPIGNFCMLKLCSITISLFNFSIAQQLFYGPATYHANGYPGMSVGFVRPYGYPTYFFDQPSRPSVPIDHVRPFLDSSSYSSSYYPDYTSYDFGNSRRYPSFGSPYIGSYGSSYASGNYYPAYSSYADQQPSLNAYFPPYSRAQIYQPYTGFSKL
ncbi:hypothetical protein Tcan_04375 [Toxocara canis]|uniref:Uncharacterized protein n=1 Tax=Toxocara canis TaxID=6265 RepID=A0A0B2V2M4_TOXCA|nr:hypothetical protein Tcan_04375 [Toxocara canis]